MSFCRLNKRKPFEDHRFAKACSVGQKKRQHFTLKQGLKFGFSETLRRSLSGGDAVIFTMPTRFDSITLHRTSVRGMGHLGDRLAQHLHG